MGPLLEAHTLRRAFGATLALEDASIAIAPGEVHALVGENGSGKSTLVKIVTGVLRADAGSLDWKGEPSGVSSPRNAQRAGIVAVYQETLVVEGLTVLDNVVMGTDGFLRRRQSRRQEVRIVQAVLDRLGLDDVRPDTLVAELSLSRKQMITVARALARPWELLVLDEATSALDIEDRDRLFATLATERERGASVLLISHRMDEIRDMADSVTVMRSGRTVQTLRGDAASTDLLLQLMSGEDEARTATHTARIREAAPPVGETVLRGTSVRLAAKARPFDLELRRGEIFGVAGLQGHGQDELLRSLAGQVRPREGVIEIDTDGVFQTVRSMRRAFRQGIAYVPGDRKREGIFGPLSVLDNQSIATLGRRSTAGVIRTRRVVAEAQRQIARLRVKTASLSTPISGLSGGNQQKVLLGRWLSAQPRVLILNDPLRGVDLGARLEICEVFAELAAEGVSIVFLSTELAELMISCDRVGVMHEGSLQTILEGGDLTQPAIIGAMFGEVAGSDHHGAR